jgi:hypothetical protein
MCTTEEANRCTWVMPVLTNLERARGSREATRSEETHGGQKRGEETRGEETHGEETRGEETRGEETRGREVVGEPMSRCRAEWGRAEMPAEMPAEKLCGGGTHGVETHGAETRHRNQACSIILRGACSKGHYRYFPRLIVRRSHSRYPKDRNKYLVYSISLRTSACTNPGQTSFT